MFIRSYFIGFLLFASITTCDANAFNDRLSSTVLEDLEGNRLTFGDLWSDKPLYVKFWATWCGTCIKQMPHFQQASEKYQNEVDIISINIDINDDLQHIEKIKTEFGLSAPIFLDVAGELGQQLGFKGTPYHILLDQQGNLAHAGHKADEVFDKTLAEVAAGMVKNWKVQSDDDPAGQALDLSLENTDYALFFLAPWCDWYLEDRRPAVRENCISGQKLANALSEKYANLAWRGISTRMWTGEKELEEYAMKFHVPFSLEIDQSNLLFIKYGVKDFPTLIVFSNGKEEFRTSDFEDENKIEAVVSKVMDD